MCIKQLYQRLKGRRSFRNRDYFTDLSNKYTPRGFDCTDFTRFENPSNTLTRKANSNKNTTSSCSSTQKQLYSLRINNKLQKDCDKYNSSISSPIRLLDSAIKEWITRAIQNDTHSLEELLRYHNELVTCIDPISGFTALHWASKHGNLHMVKLLCQSNLLQINHRSRGGYTALHLAQQYGHSEIVNVLTDEYKADTTIRDNYGCKPHQYAKRKTYNRLILQVLL